MVGTNSQKGEKALLEYGPVVVILLSVSFVFIACCLLVVKAAFSERDVRADLQMSWYGFVVFLLAVVGCRAIGEGHDSGAAAVYAFMLCGVAFAVGIPLYKGLVKAERLDARRLTHLSDLVASYREREASSKNCCARLAREFDLTRREEEVLIMLIEGRTRSEVARSLYLSDNTVKTHVRNLYKKLKVGSKDELVAVIGSHCREKQG